MHLYDGNLDSGDCVTDSIAIVSICTCVNNDSVLGFSCFVELIYNCSLVVGLEYFAGKALSFTMCLYFGIDTLEGIASVNSRLSSTEKVKIRAVDYKYISHNKLLLD